MTTTYRNYLWLCDEPFSWWTGSGYLVSLIRGGDSTEVLDALGAFAGRPAGTGLSGFQQRVSEFESMGRIDLPAMCAQTVGVADLGDGWVLMIQGNSEYVGITGELMRPIIENHEVVSHSRNVNADSRFVWWRDGQQQITFDTLGPDWDLDRAAANPTAGSPTVLALIPEVGGIERGGEGRTEFFHVPGAFALAERLTGVEVTKDLLETAEFTVAIVPVVPDERCTVDHEPPQAEPLFGDTATWAEVAQLHRSSAASNVHGIFTLTDSGSGFDEVSEAEIWVTASGHLRQADAEGLLSVTSSDGRHWQRGPYSPQTNPSGLLRIGSRWDSSLAGLIPSQSMGTPTRVGDRAAWEFDLPPGWDGDPVAVAFDAETGVVVRAETAYRTEELTILSVGQKFDDDLFTAPS